MITEYYRPDNLDDALKLLARKDPRTVALGGGLFVNEVIKDSVAVVDLQALGLNGINRKGKSIELGAAITLQDLLMSGVIDPALQKAIKHQENYNRRQVATLGGNMVSGSGRSPVLGMILALDAELELIAYQGEPQLLRLGDFLPLRQESLIGRVITSIRIPAAVKIAYEYTARSPADLPIVGACVVQWPSGRTRVVLLGYGDQPVMIFDGPEAAGADIAARDAYQEAGDQWASAGYRSDASAVLVNRCLGTIANRKEE